ncbi:hypothetical protein CRENBAI_012963, partial [Crenichthys baileyi]
MKRDEDDGMKWDEGDDMKMDNGDGMKRDEGEGMKGRTRNEFEGRIGILIEAGGVAGFGNNWWRRGSRRQVIKNCGAARGGTTAERDD